MRLNAPKVNTWWIAIVLGVLGVIGFILDATGAVDASWVMTVSFWIEFVAAALLVLATKTANL
jgi:hypothetical protein